MTFQHGGIVKKTILVLLAVIFILPFPISFAVQKTYLRKILLLGQINAETQSELRKNTGASQLQVVSLIEQLKTAGEVQYYNAFWIQNAISIAATNYALSEITKNTGVSSIDDYVIKTETRYAKNVDPEWNLKAIGAPDIWATGNKGKGVTIGVLDSGCDPTQSELKGKVSQFAYFDDYGRKGDQTVPFDGDGHGTMVSSIIAGETVGVAPEAKLVVGCVLPGGSGNLSQIIAGLQWIADPDDDPETKDYPTAVNMSFGMPSVEEYLKPGIQNLIKTGILPIASIGNEGEGSTSNPGNLPEVLSVGSVGHNLKASSFSSGDMVVWETFDDFVTVTKPDVCAPGEGVRVASLRKTYDIADGTSFSAPHVAGLCALIASQNPGINLEDLKSSILETATDLGKPGRDRRYGEGLIDSKKAIAQTQTRIKRNIKITRPGSARLYGNIKIKTSDRTYEITEELAKNFDFLAKDTQPVEISAYGFKTVVTGADEVELEPLPLYRVTLSTISPLLGDFVESSIVVKDTPLAQLDAPDGTIVLPLPEGKYTFLISSFGHSMTRVEKEITGDSEFTITLEPAKLGFIDARRSYFGTRPIPIRGKLKPALDATGMSWFYWSLSSGKVTSNQLSRFPYLIWNAGGTLDPKEISILSDYLDGGGKLVLTSTFFGASYFGETETTPFLASYFHCTGLEDGGMTIKWWNKDNYRTLALTTLWGFASSSKLIPIDDVAKPFLSYAGNEASTYAGLRVSTPKKQGIILGFTFPDISNIEDAKWLMKTCIDSFDDTVKWQAKITDQSGKPLSGTAKISDESVNFTDGELFIPHIPANGAKVSVFSYGYKTAAVNLVENGLPESLMLEKASIGQLKVSINTASWAIFSDMPIEPIKLQPNSTIDLPEGNYEITLASQFFKPKKVKITVPGSLSVQLDKKEPVILTSTPHLMLSQALGNLQLPFEARDEISAEDIISSQAFIYSSSSLPNSKTLKLADSIRTALKCGAKVILMGPGPVMYYGDPVVVDSDTTPVLSVVGSGVLDGMLISTSFPQSGFQIQGIPVISGGAPLATFIGTGDAICRYDNLVACSMAFEMIDLDVVGAEMLRKILGLFNIKAAVPKGKIVGGLAPSKTLDVTFAGFAVPLSSAFIAIDGTETRLTLDPEGYFTISMRLTEGTHKVAVVSKIDGQISISQAETLYVDTVPPKVKIWCPRGGKTSLEDFELVATVEGASTVSVDGAAQKPDGKLLRKKLSSGSGSFFIQAQDDAGNKTEMTAKLTFDPSIAVDAKGNSAVFEIDQMLASGICDATGKFEPSRNITRYECAIWTANLLGLQPLSSSSGYTDTKTGTREDGYLAALVKAGILSGKGKFEGSKTATREFIIQILVNAIKPTKQASSIKFTDIPASNYYYRAIAKAVGSGMINPDERRVFASGKFGLGQPLTRSSAAIVFYGSLLVLAKGE